MILELDQWHLGYEQILNDCRTNEDGETSSALILCHTDVDAMSSARILSYMFRSDGIQYQLLPCSSYSSLHRYLSDNPMDAVKAIILLNVGASRNLNRLFEDLIPETVKIYVLDCRRPVHLANIHAGENVVIFMDRLVTDEIPSDGDNLSGNETSSSSGSEEESEDDDESEGEFEENPDEGEEEAHFDDIQAAERDEPNYQENDNAPEQEIEYDGEDEGENREERRIRQREGLTADGQSPKQKKQRHEAETTGDDDNGGNTDGATDDEPDSPNSKLAQEEIEKQIPLEEMHRQRRERLRSYYSTGSYFGSPAAWVAYRLAAQLRFVEQGDLLWLACVGVTDAYLHHRLDVAGYSMLTMDLRRYCLRLFPDDSLTKMEDTIYAEDLASSTSRIGNRERTKITFSQNGRIISSKDYRFFLLRHWTLFQSMLHSDYIATKLQVWTKGGMHQLQEFLAKMGIPLSECNERYAFMHSNHKRRLREKIIAHAAVSPVV